MNSKPTEDAFWVYVTTSDRHEALTLARSVVEERLAACANLLGGIESVYWWDGAVQEGHEVALVLKTTASKQTALIARLTELHSYKVPCIVSLPMAEGNPDFLHWLQREVNT